MTFADETAVRAADGSRFQSEIVAGWDIGGNANGGYLLAILARAATEATGKPHPVAMSAHYLAPGKPGPVTVDVDVQRIGGRHATAIAVMRAGDTPLVSTVVTTTDLARAEGPDYVDAEPPPLPDPDDCTPMRSALGSPTGFMERVELRLHPDDAGFLQGEGSGRARVRGWFRLRNEAKVDPIGLLVAVDSFPPTIFNANLPVGWTPTVELTAHVRGVPVDGWLRCAFSTRFVTGGYLEEDGEVWDAGDRLIAQSRQLALIPRPA